MSRTVVRYMMLVWCCVAGAGCAPVISRQFREQMGTPIPFESLVLNPDFYQGRLMLLGGYILETENTREGTVLIVLQAPLGYRDEPGSRELSQGRFLLRSIKFLDPAIYSKDRRVTVGGAVAGSQQRELGSGVYNYPVIDAQQWYLWPKDAYYVAPYYPPYWGWYDPWDSYPYMYPPFSWGPSYYRGPW
jgi:outer membrane lipoprotein